MLKSADQWIDQYRLKEALWIHNGDPRQPHALLTSGNHSSGFFNSRPVIGDILMLRDAVSDLFEVFISQGGEVSDVQMVVGPQTGATEMAHLSAQLIHSLTRRHCMSASPAKRQGNGWKFMAFNDAESSLVSNKSVLLCEDVLTTGSSVKMTVSAIKDSGGVVLPYILVLVNRSGFSEVDGRKIVALIDHPMPIWTPEQCPLCKVGSDAVRPKDNWKYLNQSG